MNPCNYRQPSHYDGAPLLPTRAMVIVGIIGVSNQ